MWEGLGAALANVGGSIYSANKQAQAAERAAEMQAKQQAAMNKLMQEQLGLARESQRDQLAQRQAGQEAMEQGLAQSAYGNLGNKQNQPGTPATQPMMQYARL